MKKLFFVLSLVLGLSIAATAQSEGGLFHRGNSTETEERGFAKGGLTPALPGEHGLSGNQPAPLGSGALLLIGFGAAYALSTKNKK